MSKLICVSSKHFSFCDFFFYMYITLNTLNTKHTLGFPDSSVGKESTCNAGDPSPIPGWGRSAGEGIGYPLQNSWTFLVAQLVKSPHLGSIPGLGRSPGEGKGYSLQYSGLKNSMDCIVHRVAKSRTWWVTFTHSFTCDANVVKGSLGCVTCVYSISMVLITLLLPP